MILLLDNFDSFTFNLADYFYQMNVEPDVQRNGISLENLKKKNYSAIVLSPGPGKPTDYTTMAEVIHYYHSRLPILGICLGHQAVGCYFGATLERSIRPMHGKISSMKCKEDPLFKGLPSTMDVVRYHSLVLTNIPSAIEIIGATSEGEVMAIKHKEFPVYGLQFHPEAILTQYGKDLLKNWIFLHKITN